MLKMRNMGSDQKFYYHLGLPESLEQNPTVEDQRSAELDVHWAKLQKLHCITQKMSTNL
jgi:hypothetical protein